MTCLDYRACLSRTAGKFGVVFADPPYKMDCAGEILSLVAARGLLEEGGAVVYESEREENAPAGWERYDLRNYGRTKIAFFRQVQGE